MRSVSVAGGKGNKILVMVAVLLFVAAACGDGDGGAASEAQQSTGPIEIWYSNNPEEIAWGEQVVKAWNDEHPNEEVTGQEIPAGETSEEVIAAAITAGNTPCLIFNTAPAAVPQFERAGGLVDLAEFEDGASYIEERSGDRAAQYQYPEDEYNQMPWKANPVMIFYNKDLFDEAGLDSENPPLSTYDEFLQTSQTLVDKAGVQAAIWPAPSSEFFQPWFDFYPLFIAQTGGGQLVEDGEAQFNSEDGIAVAEFWRQMYERGLSQQEAYNGDAFADQKSAMSIVGPWAIAVYGKDINWGVAPVPTQDGVAPEETFTFADEKSIGMYSTCENQQTAWEFLKFVTNEDNDGLLLEETGQMPMRTDVTGTYPDYFDQKPEYQFFAEQADRTVEVPMVPSSIDVWQEFRDAYSASVIFRDDEIQSAFDGAAETINGLVEEGS
ncbi:MAG: ABC transporter substrate-binding protein [Actinomycetota bacterium]